MMDKEGFRGQYDFIYLPIVALRHLALEILWLWAALCNGYQDFRSKANLGYAFVNLVDEPQASGQLTKGDPFSDSWQVQQFWQIFDGYTKWVLPSAKAGALQVDPCRL